MPHQKQALAWMIRREEGVGLGHGPAGGILADDMGLGARGVAGCSLWGVYAVTRLGVGRV